MFKNRIMLGVIAGSAALVPVVGVSALTASPAGAVKTGITCSKATGSVNASGTAKINLKTCTGNTGGSGKTSGTATSTSGTITWANAKKTTLSETTTAGTKCTPGATLVADEVIAATSPRTTPRARRLVRQRPGSSAPTAPQPGRSSFRWPRARSWLSTRPNQLPDSAHTRKGARRTGGPLFRALWSCRVAHAEASGVRVCDCARRDHWRGTERRTQLRRECEQRSDEAIFAAAGRMAACTATPWSSPSEGETAATCDVSAAGIAPTHRASRTGVWFSATGEHRPL